MSDFTNFIDPGLLVLVPVLYIIGTFIKHINLGAAGFLFGAGDRRTLTG